MTTKKYKKKRKTAFAGLILAMLFGHNLYAGHNVPENVTTSVLSPDYVDMTVNDIFAVGDDGNNHRVHTDNLGNIYTNSNATTGSAQTVTFTVGQLATVALQNLIYGSITTTAIDIVDIDTAVDNISQTAQSSANSLTTLAGTVTGANVNVTFTPGLLSTGALQITGNTTASNIYASLSTTALDIADIDANSDLQAATILPPADGGTSNLMTGPYYASVTFTSTSGAVTGVTIVAAVVGKTIDVIAFGISTDTAGRITLHHQGGAAVRSNGTIGNIIGGGLFGANGGETNAPGYILRPGLAQNQPVCADYSIAMTNIETWVMYFLF